MLTNQSYRLRIVLTNEYYFRFTTKTLFLTYTG